MTMTPERFRDLLDQATALVPAQSTGDELAEGHRRLRRRRIATAAAGVVAVGVIAVGSALAVPALTDSEDSIQPAPAPLSGDAKILEGCRQSPEADAGIAALYDSGTPTVVASVATDLQVVAALESADGAYWAECTVELTRQEFPATMTVWDAVGPQTGPISVTSGFTTSPGCALTEDLDIDPSCGTFAVSWVERLPDPVAAVRYDLTNDDTVAVGSTDGFVVLNYLGPLPEGMTMKEDGLPGRFAPLARVTYLDAAGKELAAEGLDEFSGIINQPVDGLPPLDDYPVERGDNVS